MKVNEVDVASIVLTVLDEMQMGPGGRVQPELLHEKWPETGLRDSDLDRALALLLQAQALIQDQLDEDKQFYRLTDEGHKRMVALNSPLTFGLASYQRLRRNAERRLQERQAVADKAAADAQVLVDRRRRSGQTRH